MKKLFIPFLTLFLLISTTLPVQANVLNQQIEYYDDGSYIITVIEDVPSDITLLSTTVTKSKTSTYHSSTGEALWSITVTGTFTYGNGTSKCTSSSINTKIYNSNWSIGNKSSSANGNKASATATAIQYLKGHEVQRITKTVTLTCSSTGKFS
ncbi:MAG: hypothetical protein V8R80_00245 [Eubacterium sp.]